MLRFRRIFTGWRGFKQEWIFWRVVIDLLRQGMSAWWLRIVRWEWCLRVKDTITTKLTLKWCQSPIQHANSSIRTMWWVDNALRCILNKILKCQKIQSLGKFEVRNSMVKFLGWFFEWKISFKSIANQLHTERHRDRWRHVDWDGHKYQPLLR